MAVDQSEILKEAISTLRDDAGLLALLGEASDEAGKARVYNHVPQDDAQPYVVVIWQADEDYDTKDSTGFDGSLDHEVVSNHHGDKIVLQVIDAIIAAYKASPLALLSGRIVCFDYQSGSVPVQVLETHRAIASFNVLVDADGIGGIPVDPPTGGLIIVQDESVDLANTPHRKLNFLGAGVDASDAGGDVADIVIPGGGVSVISYVSDRWYSADPHGDNEIAFGVGTDKIQSGRLGAVPILIKENINIDGLGLLLKGAPVSGSNGDFRVGIWADNAGLPGALLADSGSKTTGFITDDDVVFLFNAIASVALSEGIVWIGGLRGSMTNGTKGRGILTPSNYFLDLGFDETRMGAITDLATGGIVGFIDTTDTGRSPSAALPDPFPISSLTLQDKVGGAQGYILVPHFRIK